jgi:hypothetical protein
MSASQQPNTPPTTSTWTEPPWSGWIETTGDALLILEAARRGLIPRVTRRLVDSERKMITSGSVFVFDEDESGIKRWTDGFFWSPSRILGNFLLYRETDKRGAGHRGLRSDPPPSDVNEQSQYNVDGVKLEGQTLSRPKGEGGQMGVDRHRERTLMGSLTNSYKFKPDGLMKKTFSLTIGGVSQHLISYYRIEDVEGGRLRSPSSLPELASLDISPEYLDKTHFRNPPKVEIGVDGLPRYRGEADDVDSSPVMLPAALSSGLPLLPDGRTSESAQTQAKRAKRYDPYAPTGNSKRTRKGKGNQADPSTPTDQLPQQPLVAQQPHPHGYPDPGMAVMHPPHFAAYAGYYQMPAYPMPPPVMYPASPYPNTAPAPNSSPPAAIPQGTAQPAPQYSYTGFTQPPNGVDPGQAGLGGQQAYYPYYPPHPHAPYPGYHGVWPHYAGYPPQPVPQLASAPSAEAKPSTTIEVPDGDADGVDSEET